MKGGGGGGGGQAGDENKPEGERAVQRRAPISGVRGSSKPVPEEEEEEEEGEPTQQLQPPMFGSTIRVRLTCPGSVCLRSATRLLSSSSDATVDKALAVKTERNFRVVITK